MLYFTVACDAVTFETDSTFALAVDASPCPACPLMIEENWLPFSSRATRLAVGVLKLKKAVQLAVIALLADPPVDVDVPVVAVVALGVAAGVEVPDVFELEGVPPLLPQAAAATATTDAPRIFRACL
jgi:hypothetical protein